MDTGFYKRNGLEVDLIFIPSSTTAVSSVVAGDIHLANNSGGAVANAAVGGASLVMTACYINTLPYELVVQESIKSADLKGKSVGISRVGSASDAGARLGQRARAGAGQDDADLAGRRSAERAAAFRTGRIAGFPSSRNYSSRKACPIALISTTSRSASIFPASANDYEKLSGDASRDRKELMALIEATQFLKTPKEESKKLIAKYSRQNNPAYLRVILRGGGQIT